MILTLQSQNRYDPRFHFILQLPVHLILHYWNINPTRPDITSIPETRNPNLQVRWRNLGCTEQLQCRINPLQQGKGQPGSSSGVPVGWPQANNRELAEPNETVYILDEDDLLEPPDLSLLVAVLGSEVPQYRALTANQGRPAGWQTVPSMWRITPFTYVVVFGRSTGPNQPAPIAARTTSQEILPLIDKLKRLRPDADVSSYGMMTVCDKIFAAPLQTRGLPAGNNFNQAGGCLQSIFGAMSRFTTTLYDDSPLAFSRMFEKPAPLQGSMTNQSAYIPCLHCSFLNIRSRLLISGD